MARKPVPQKSRSAWDPLWGVLVVGLAVRAFYYFSSLQSPFYEPRLLDPAYYHQWALGIVRGEPEQGVFYGLPLYPYFLAFGYQVFNGSLAVVKWAQIFLGLVTIFLIGRIGEKIASPKAGWMAAGLAAVYGPLFFHEAILIPEVLSLPLYALSFYWACSFDDKPTVVRGAGLGGAIGLSALTKAGILPFALLFLVVEFFKETGNRKRIVSIIICLAAILGTLAPVTAHNFFHGHDRVFLTSHAGFNFYIGNNPQAEGVFNPPEGTGTNVEAQIEDSRAVAERALGRSLKPSEVSAYWSGQAVEFIRNHPGRFLWLCARKLLLFFDAREISDVDDYSFGKHYSAFLRLPWPDFAVLGPLVFVGIFMARGRRYRAITLLWVGFYLAGIMLFFVNARYRLPILGVFFPLAGAGLAELGRAVEEKSWTRLLACAAILAAGFGIGHLGLVQKNEAREYLNVGDIYSETNQLDPAIESYRQALFLDPDYVKASLAMGVALTKKNRIEEAKEHYLKVLRLDAHNSMAYNNLGLLYDRDGNLGEAELYFLKALEAKPHSAEAHNNLGMVYGKRGQNLKAIEEFRMSIKFNPKNARTYTNLGLVLYGLGRRDEAVRCWKKALEIDPKFPEAKLALGHIERQKF